MNSDIRSPAEGMPFVAPCRQLAVTAPIGWVRLGWQDIRRAPLISLGYGAIMAILALGMTAFAYAYGSYWLLIALLSGLVFIGPVLCIGIYAISAQLERGQGPTLERAVREERRHLGHEMIFALVILVIFLVWARAGSMVHIFFPAESSYDISDLVTYLGVGSLVGAVFAIMTFAASAFSLPMIMHRDVDAVTAVVTSINAVLRNKKAMAVWILIILAALLAGILTGMLGLAVTLPLIGHATWHGYLETIDAEAFPRHARGVTSTRRQTR